MQFKSKNFRNSLLIGFLSSTFLFTGCSQKNNSNVDYSKFYKDTKNTNINNSKNMHKYTLRPYSVFGVKYYPFIANVGDKFEGIASWYGPDFHAKKTSNGEIYNMYDMTAAHKTLPMNTVVRVDNLENNKSIIVRINDRGPFVSGRIIDLSNKAAHEIDMVRNGTAKVRVTVLGYNGEIENKNAPYAQLPSNNSANVAQVEKVEPLIPLEIKENITTQKIDKVLVSNGNYHIQVGAFSKSEGAIKTKDDYQRMFSSNKVETEKIFANNRYLFKVFIRGFKSYEQAQEFKNLNNLNNAIIVNN